MSMKKQQQEFVKEDFFKQITKFIRERIIPLYKKETSSAYLFAKSYLNKHNQTFKQFYSNSHR